jgi:ADP-ribosylation factor GTPase-activating protein 1
MLVVLNSSLGVHISFVRSIAMDSWTPQQMALMKGGGNKQCNDYLQAKGIGPRVAIKQKYESDAAQLYKQVLKARVEGTVEPTELVKPPPRSNSGYISSAPSSGNNSAGFTNAASTDPNGMERLAGETDQQYIARQTRLREEAKARMAAKFGSGGTMGGVGSNGGRMGGVGSDSSYNPYSGYGAGGGVDSLIGGVSSIMGSVTGAIGSVANEHTLNSVKQTGSSFWGSLTSTVGSVASAVTQPDSSDGLADLQRSIAAQKPKNSVYSGFGSDTYSTGSGRGSSNGLSGSTVSSAHSNLQEAQGLPHEDKNGIERLTGESDEQYVMRQTRLREEARARMAAKFGGGSSSMGGFGGGSTTPPRHPSGGLGGMGQNPPMRTTGSGSATPPPQKERLNSDDFFSSFGN